MKRRDFLAATATAPAAAAPALAPVATGNILEKVQLHDEPVGDALYLYDDMGCLCRFPTWSMRNPRHRRFRPFPDLGMSRVGAHPGLA